jgi:Domain of unknown function (DUF4055)
MKLISESNSVSFKKKELQRVLDQYALIYDALEGEMAIKEAASAYLPQPEDKPTASSLLRYEKYIKRAVFYNATRRTLLAMSGQVFSVSPKIEIPTLMDSFVKNCNGENVSLELLSKKIVEIALAYSRCGIFVDFPFQESDSSVAQLKNGEIKPIFRIYSPMNIWNWQTVQKGADRVLSLLVLAEVFDNFKDGEFSSSEAQRLRVLRLTENGCTVEIFESNSKALNSSKTNFNSIFSKSNAKSFTSVGVFQLKDSTGSPLTEIPFRFIGGENNNFDVDSPIFYDLASLNLAHYRNSADYEEACFVLGQPTPVFTGLTKDWVTEVMGGEAKFGSRGGVLLPINATAQLLQAAENTMIKEAMETKERQMAALGARLVEQRTVQRTAFETKVETSSQSSTLINVANNVSESIEKCLKIAYSYLASDEPKIEFKLNTDYDISKLSHEERQRVLAEWQAGALSFTEMREVLRRSGAATQDDIQAQTEIEVANQKKIEDQLALQSKQSNFSTTKGK